MAIKKSTITRIVDDVLFEMADDALSDEKAIAIATEIAGRLQDETDDVTDDGGDDAEYDDEQPSSSSDED